MRKLLNTLFVQSPDSYITLDGETVVVKYDEEGKPDFRVPLLNLESILAFGYKGASPALMAACASRNIALSFFSPTGRFLARVTGEERGNVLLRREQYRVADSPEKSLPIARAMIAGKLYNSRWVLERATRDHALRVDVDRLKNASGFVREAIAGLENISSLDSLRGVEGEAATRYFGVWDELILQNKQHFFFKGRNRRPPLDNINALLSFCYTLLAHDAAAALESVGLDPYVGFLHSDRPGRISLALDMMEEFRPVIVDRFVLGIVNKRIVAPEGFKCRENGAVVMNDATRKQVLSAWQERKRDVIMHPFFEEKMEWGLVPYAQAMLLARHLRGDIDAYPPFLWK